MLYYTEYCIPIIYYLRNLILSTYHEKSLRFQKVHEIKIKTKLCTQNIYKVYRIKY
jgi:hypothetical protein